jgi:hypothetical protein
MRLFGEICGWKREKNTYGRGYYTGALPQTPRFLNA